MVTIESNKNAYKTTDTSGDAETDASELNGIVSTDDYNSDRRDAERYRYIRRHMEWRRSGTLADDDSHAFVGCQFPYLANFECAAMMDYNIDKMIDNEKEEK